jgi:hypothetical protein
MKQRILHILRILALIGCTAGLTGCFWIEELDVTGTIATDAPGEDLGVGGAPGTGDDEDPDDGFVRCPPAIIGNPCGSRTVCGPAVNGWCQCKSSC